jgi:hypothetical protein
MARWSERSNSRTATRERIRPRDLQERELTARHEAGHAVVAHALGRRVISIRATALRLPTGHPHNPFNKPVVSAGFTLNEPRRAEEINAQLDAGRAFTEDQTDWLLEEVVICLAGGLAESSATDRATARASAAADLHQCGQIAGMLGRFVERGSAATADPVFLHLAETATRVILDALDADVLLLAKTLITNPVAGEDTIRKAFSELPCGSHRWVLDPLRNH